MIQDLFKKEEEENEIIKRAIEDSWNKTPRVYVYNYGTGLFETGCPVEETKKDSQRFDSFFIRDKMPRVYEYNYGTGLFETGCPVEETKKDSQRFDSFFIRDKMPRIYEYNYGTDYIPQKEEKRARKRIP